MTKKQEFKELYGHVRHHGGCYWNADEIEGFCRANGEVGNAVLYAIIPAETYCPTITAQTMRFFSGVPLTTR